MNTWRSTLLRTLLRDFRSGGKPPFLTCEIIILEFIIPRSAKSTKMKNRSHHTKVRYKLERLLTLLCLLVLVATPRAQQPTTATKQSPDDRAPLYQALLDLTNP